VPALNWIKRVGWATTFVLIVLWPALSTPAGVFTKTYFAFWIFVVLAWGFFASVVIVGLPIYESFEEISTIAKALVGLGGASKDEIALSERAGKSVDALLGRAPPPLPSPPPGPRPDVPRRGSPGPPEHRSSRTSKTTSGTPMYHIPPCSAAHKRR
jgi:hypothetical protein